MPETPIVFRGGRLPAEPARPHLKLARLLKDSLPAPPASADWLSTLPEGAWGMCLNDKIGDCTCAGVAHKRIGDTYVNQGHAVRVADGDVLKLYETVGHYVPGEQSTDNGAVCQDVLDYWHKHGVLGEKIVAYAKVDIANETEVKQAIALFGQLYCGFNVPSTAMDQFNQGEPWSVVRGARIEGGHCVTVGAYDADSLTAVTWGETQRMTWQFFKKYFDEAWVLVGPDFLNPKTGKDRSGLDLKTLEKDFTALTGRGLAA